MFSGCVSNGRWPRITIRSKQWYTNASRLPKQPREFFQSVLSLPHPRFAPRAWDSGPMEVKSDRAMNRTAFEALPPALYCPLSGGDTEISIFR
jgi:hypothetical protein